MYPGVVGATMMVKTDTLIKAQTEREKVCAGLAWLVSLANACHCLQCLSALTVLLQMALKLERAECKDQKTGEISETKVLASPAIPIMFTLIGWV